ncbi:MAG: NAD(P)H-dependent glycerol-3-phosphate dehydrogenase [Burkholderiales bacterium]|nr:NAD(P)-dependent glycerol-3-phosphate dehydrogenase [Limnohabitans sp.]MCF8181148.1 NAD(P)-dependent glycerol-3-phosphate dehydrogenase [Burkholderiaceae bacterium]
MKIAVIGAGAWGTALAISASRHAAGHRVQLWTRDAAAAKAMQSQRSNQRYLPDVNFPDALQCASSPDSELASWAATQDLIVIGTPMSALRGMLMKLQDIQVPVAWLCKGFEAASEGVGSGAMPHEVCQQVAPNIKSGALSGPSFALEVARAQPTALVAASAHASVQQMLVNAFHSPSLRVYANEDIVGVEVGGAVKNVLAIATGLSDGLNLGLNARAALITRGLSEMTRLGVALGAKAETFMGLSGLGDLVLTATGDLSRNRKVGLLLAQGMDLQQAVQSLGHVAEGVYSARTVVMRAQALGVDMPISQGVLALLEGKLKPTEAVAALMGRGAKDEN